MEFTITTQTKVKVGKKSLEQVQGLFLAMLSAIDGGDAKEMFRSIDNLKERLGRPVVRNERRAVPFSVMLSDLRRAVNMGNADARKAKLAQMQELMSSLEEDGAISPETETIKKLLINRLSPVSYSPGCNLITLDGVSDIIEQALDIVVSTSKLQDLMNGMGFLEHVDDNGDLSYPVRFLPNDCEPASAERVAMAVRKLFEVNINNPMNGEDIAECIATFLVNESVMMEVLDNVLKDMGYLHSTNDGNSRYSIRLKSPYLYLLNNDN